MLLPVLLRRHPVSDSKVRSNPRFHFLLKIVAEASSFLSESATKRKVRLIQFSCHIAGFFFLAREIFRHSFFKDGALPTDRIFAGISGYILLGLFSRC